MYAVIATGGKQYGVSKGEVLTIEKLDGEKGSELSLEEVLLVSDGGKTQIGQPFVSGARVQLEVLGPVKGEKLIIFKKRRRHGSRVKKGHRQQFTKVRVTEIIAS